MNSRADSSTTRRRVRSLAVAIALVVLAGACSSSDGSPESDAAPSASTTIAGSTTSTTAPAEVDGSAGCGTEPAVAGPAAEVPGDVALTFDAAGVERAYRLGIPKGYDPDVAAPLLLNLHGSGSNAIQQSVYSDLPAQASKRGAITVTPDAINGQWELSPTGSDDEFLMALLDHVEAGYCVDRTDVHVLGISLGAWKASLVACEHPDRIASAVLVAEEVWPQCPPMSVAMFHGTADRVVPYGEGADPGVVVEGPNRSLTGARHNAAEWAAGGGCDPAQVVEKIGDDVERWTYEGCDEGIDVELYSVAEGGHTWPGSDIKIGPTTQTVDATEIALDFFESHPLRRG